MNGGPGPRSDPPTADAGGPLLALCRGQRCSALRALSGTEGSVEQLGDAVRDTRGAVLVSVDCLGPCALATVAVIAHRDGDTGAAGRTVWLSGVQDAQRAEALARWITTGGPAPGASPDTGLPPVLVEAVAGLGPPMRIAGAPRPAG